MTRTDVLVLGGGPAGSTVATLLARAGARVLLLEKDSFPRNKVCGEFVSPEGRAVLERLGLAEAMRAAGAANIDRCLISIPKGKAVEFSLPDIPHVGRTAVGVTRARLDQALLQLAAASGADVQERMEAVAPLVEGGRVVGVRARRYGAPPGSETNVTADRIVAADGRRSVIQRFLDPGGGDPSRSTPGSWFGLKRHLGDPSGRLRERVELHLFRGGYAGLGPVESSGLNLCLLTTVSTLRACGGSADRLVESRVMSNPRARESLEGVQAAGDWLAVGPLRFGVRRPALAGAILVGDAAGPVDPFSGEGISNALTGAEIAARTILESHARRDEDRWLERRWAREWAQVYAAGLRRVRTLGRVFEIPSLGAFALSLASLPGGGAVLARIVRSTRTAAAASRPRSHLT